jgi:hypothetical protein
MARLMGFAQTIEKHIDQMLQKRRGAKCAPFLSVIMFRALKVLEVAYDSFDLPIAIT